MLGTGWITALALAVSSTPPAGTMAVVPLPPTWTAASCAVATEQPSTAPGVGGPAVQPGASRSGRRCLRELVRLGIPFKRVGRTRGVDTPVIVTGPIRGLRLTPMWGKRPALMDCIYALTVYRMAPLVLRAGINELRYSSIYSYRNVAGTRVLSRHAFGLAMDVFEVRGPGGVSANVKKDWVKALGRPGNCIGAVRSRKGRLLRSLVCALEESRLLSLIMTPDTDYAHRDHFHMAGLRATEKPHRRVRYAGRPKGRTWISGRAVRRPRRRARRLRHRRRHRARKARRRAARHRPSRRATRRRTAPRAASRPRPPRR